VNAISFHFSYAFLDLDILNDSSFPELLIKGEGILRSKRPWQPKQARAKEVLQLATQTQYVQPENGALSVMETKAATA
jgi:hypothetical protein